MLLLAILLLSVNLLVLGGGGYVVVKRLGMVEDSLYNAAQFFNPETEGEAAPAVELVSKIGESIATQVGDSVNHQLRGILGGAMKGVNAELEAEAVAGNPALAIMQGMPKSVKKNPLLFAAMQQIINQHLPKLGGGASGAGSNHEGKAVQFNF